ncbi:MAG TPA: hypothetical protein PLH39_03295, partial [Promineifilum sp.]|nr:hypothetical protein [Promineifilum sp.]
MRRWRALSIALLVVAATAWLTTAALAARERFLLRGSPAWPEAIPQGGAQTGINVYLDGADDAELATTFHNIRATDIIDVKQTFHYGQDFDWAAAGRLLAAAATEELTVVPLLDGDPAAAYAPPAPAAFAAWAGEFAARYGQQIDAYIIWDEPNL